MVQGDCDVDRAAPDALHVLMCTSFTVTDLHSTEAQVVFGPVDFDTHKIVQQN